MRYKYKPSQRTRVGKLPEVLLMELDELGVRVRTGSMAKLSLRGANPSGQLRRSRCSTEGSLSSSLLKLNRFLTLLHVLSFSLVEPRRFSSASDSFLVFSSRTGSESFRDAGSELRYIGYNAPTA